MRPHLNEYLMELAQVAAKRTTCIRRGVGCVLADARGRVLAVSYNGVAAKLPHCNEPYEEICGFSKPIRLFVNKAGHPVHYPFACIGWDLPPGQDSCDAVHAEANALVQCRNPDLIASAHCTLEPCVPCTKLLLNTPCDTIHCGAAHEGKTGRALWEKAGRSWQVNK